MRPWEGLARAGASAALSSVLIVALVLTFDNSVGGAMKDLDRTAWGYQWAMHMSTVVGVGLLAAIVWAVGRWNRWAAALVAAGFAAVPAYWMGSVLASGDWIAGQSYAWIVRFGPAVGAGTGLGSLSLLGFFAAPGGKRPRLAWVLTGVVALSAVVFAAADAKVMPGLHPTFHLFCHAVACLFVLLACVRVACVVNFGRARIVAALLGVVAGGTGVGLASGIPPGVKGQMLLRSPIAGHAIRTFTLVGGASLGELVLDPDQRNLMDKLPLPRGLIQTGDDWNVVLVLVDTLRADALPPLRTAELEFAGEEDTPFLDQWLAESFQFTRAYSQASATHYSVPPMFRSAHPFEDAERVGVPLPEYIGELGRQPLAIVNHHFVEQQGKAKHRASDRLIRLTDDFDRLSVYPEAEMEQILPEFEAQLDAIGKDPFFAWVHFYNMHDPGFDGTRLGPMDGSWPERYRRSLVWLDGQMRELQALLERRGIADKTIVILASDHGEALGQHGAKFHGRHVFDETIRVPLAIHVPGMPGRRVDALASNLDVIPTVADLLGAPLEPIHRGLSLVPLMVGAIPEWDRSIYATNWEGQSIAVIHGHDKLIYDADAGLFLRFDLANDPGELESLFDETGEIDKTLKQQLLNLNPAAFAEELATPEKQREIEKQLEAVNAKKPKAGLIPLLRIAALNPTQKMFQEARRIFRRTKHDRVRAIVLEAMYASDNRRWTNQYRWRISKVQGKKAEVRFVTELADLGQAPIAMRLTAERMQHWAEVGTPEQWRPWLRLVQRWEKRRFVDYRGGLAIMLQRAAADPDLDVQILRSILANLASFERAPADAELAALASQFTAHEDELVRVYATKALGKVGASGDLATLDELRQAESIRLKTAALDAAIAIDREGAETRLLEHAEDPAMIWAVVSRLRTHGTLASLSFLKQARSHESGWVRSRAERAVKAINRRFRKRREQETTGTEGDATDTG